MGTNSNIKTKEHINKLADKLTADLAYKTVCSSEVLTEGCSICGLKIENVTKLQTAKT